MWYTLFVFELKTTGFDKLSLAISKMESGLKDLGPELMAVGKVQQKSIQKRFKDGGKPLWEDITYHTRKRRKANKSGFPLTEHGSLAKSSSSLKSTAGSAFELTKTRLTMGSLENRARALQDPRRLVKVYNTDNKWTGMMKTMPARPFLYFDAEDKDDFTEAAGLSIENRMRELFK